MEEEPLGILPLAQDLAEPPWEVARWGEGVLVRVRGISSKAAVERPQDREVLVASSRSPLRLHNTLCSRKYWKSAPCLRRGVVTR